jgi:hypothetical protein
LTKVPAKDLPLLLVSTSSFAPRKVELAYIHENDIIKNKVRIQKDIVIVYEKFFCVIYYYNCLLSQAFYSVN